MATKRKVPRPLHVQSTAEGASALSELSPSHVTLASGSSSDSVISVHSTVYRRIGPKTCTDEGTDKLIIATDPVIRRHGR